MGSQSSIYLSLFLPESCIPGAMPGAHGSINKIRGADPTATYHGSAGAAKAGRTVQPLGLEELGGNWRDGVPRRSRQAGKLGEKPW